METKITTAPQSKTNHYAIKDAEKLRNLNADSSMKILDGRISILDSKQTPTTMQEKKLNNYLQ